MRTVKGRPLSPSGRLERWPGLSLLCANAVGWLLFHLPSGPSMEELAHSLGTKRQGKPESHFLIKRLTIWVTAGSEMVLQHKGPTCYTAKGGITASSCFNQLLEAIEIHMSCISSTNRPCPFSKLKSGPVFGFTLLCVINFGKHERNF